MKKLAAAVVGLAAAAVLTPATSFGDGYFGDSANFSWSGPVNSAVNTVHLQAYGNNDVNWYGQESVKVSKLNFGIYNSSGKDPERLRLKPIVDFDGVSLSADSGGSFGAGPYSNSCSTDVFYGVVGDASLRYVHDGVACTGKASDITSVEIINQAAARYNSTWYGYTVKESYDW